MSEDLKTNLEILSKIVIQLKSEQKDIVKTLKAEIEELKESNTLLIKNSKENNNLEVQNLTNEINLLKKTIGELVDKNNENLKDFQISLEQTDKDLREDMFKLLKKYEQTISM